MFFRVDGRCEYIPYADKRRQIQTAEAALLNEVIVAAEGLEVPLVALYLLTIVGILGAGAFVVSRQVGIIFSFKEGEGKVECLYAVLAHDFSHHVPHSTGVETALTFLSCAGFCQG